MTQTENKRVNAPDAIGGCNVQPRYQTTKLKSAWIRDDVPPGYPAPRYFHCECGRKVKTGIYGEGPDVKCECGINYTNTGWITRP